MTTVLKCITSSHPPTPPSRSSINAHPHQPYDGHDTPTNAPQPHAPQPQLHPSRYNLSQQSYYEDFLPNVNPLPVPQPHPNMSYSDADYESHFPLNPVQVQPSGYNRPRDNIYPGSRGFNVYDGIAANEMVQNQGRMMYTQWHTQHQQTPVQQRFHDAPSSSFGFNSPLGYPVWPGLMGNPGRDAASFAQDASPQHAICSPLTHQTPMPSTLSSQDIIPQHVPISSSSTRQAPTLSTRSASSAQDAIPQHVHSRLTRSPTPSTLSSQKIIPQRVPISSSSTRQAPMPPTLSTRSTSSTQDAIPQHVHTHQAPTPSTMSSQDTIPQRVPISSSSTRQAPIPPTLSTRSASSAQDAIPQHVHSRLTHQAPTPSTLSSQKTIPQRVPISSSTLQAPMPSTFSTKAVKAKEKTTLPPPAPCSKGVISLRAGRASQTSVNTPSEALHTRKETVDKHKEKEDILFAKQDSERGKSEEKKGIPVPTLATSKKGGGRKRKQLTFLDPISTAEGLERGKRRKVEKINQASIVGDVVHVAASASTPGPVIPLQENNDNYQTEYQDPFSFPDVDQNDPFSLLFSAPFLHPDHHDSTTVPTSFTSSTASTPSLAPSSSRSASASISPPTPLFDDCPDVF